MGSATIANAGTNPRIDHSQAILNSFFFAILSPSSRDISQPITVKQPSLRLQSRMSLNPPPTIIS